MKIRATRIFRNDVGMVRRGAEIDIRDVDAKSLVKRGLATIIEQPADIAPTAGSAAPKHQRRQKAAQPGD